MTSHRTRYAGLWPGVLLLLALALWLVIQWPQVSLWYDEALTTYVATDSWATLWHWCTQVDIQVPFHYVVLRLWVGLLGDSEFALRLLSAVSALLAAAALIAIGRLLTGRRGVGYAAGALLITMPGALWIAYEVRAYALGLALYAWATAFLCILVRDHQRGRWRWPMIVAYALLMLATLYTHYTALAGFAAHLAILGVVAVRQWFTSPSAPLSTEKAVERGVRPPADSPSLPAERGLGGEVSGAASTPSQRREGFRLLAAVALLVGIGFAPWLPTLLVRGGADRSYFPGAPIPPDRATAVMLGFKLLGRDDLPGASLPLVIGYGQLIILGVLLGGQGGRWRAALTGLMITIWPVALVAALVYFKPKLAGRYAWPGWVGFDLLAALCIVALARWWRPLGVVALIGILALPWTSGERGHPPDSDFRGAFAYLCEHGTPNDMIALRDGTLFVANRYYGRRAPCTTERRAVDMPAALMTNVDEALTLPLAQAAMQEIRARRPPNVWVVAWQGDTMDPQAMAYALLDGAGQHTLVGKMFGDVRLDRYKNPQPVSGDPVALAQPLITTPVPGGPTLQAVRLFAPAVAHAGDTIVLQAWWMRGPKLQPDLRVSARITTPDGGWTYTQVDQPPAGWKYVDDRWQEGIPSLGRYELVVGPDVPPGKMAIRYMLYDANGRWTPVNLLVGEIEVAR